MLLRAGFIDKAAAGIYTMLPLGLRALRKIEKIIADQMDSLGAQRVVMVANGKVTVPSGREAEVNRIKRAYSREAVKRDTKRFGWQVTEQDGGRRLVAARRV